jgi:Mor family transcriptional regulator
MIPHGVKVVRDFYFEIKYETVLGEYVGGQGFPLPNPASARRECSRLRL